MSLFLLANITVRRLIKSIRTMIMTVMIVLITVSFVVAKEPASEITTIVINIPSFTLSMMQGDRVVKRYSVAVGKPSAPTPLGEFRIISKVVNPTWYPPDGGNPVPPGTDNPLGRRWLGFLPNGYGIHGNNNESSIGKAVSLGCVRMHNTDVEELFERIPVGTKLRITYETVEVAVDPTTGQRHLVLYPDVYQQGTTTVALVKEKLSALGLSNNFTEERIAAAIGKTGTTPFYICLGMKVQLAGKEVIVDTEVVNGEMLIAVRPILEAFGLPVVWDAKRQLVVSGLAELPAYVKNGQSFVHLTDLEKKLGIMSHWHESEQILKLFNWQVKAEEVELAGGAWLDDEGIWLAVAPVAQVLDVPVKISLERAVVVDTQNKEWEGKVLGKDLYVSLETLTEILPVKVIILEEQKRIEIVRVPSNSHLDIFFQEKELVNLKLN